MGLLPSSDYLTIDIGFRYIKIAQVRQKRNKDREDLMIVNYGIGTTPKGCIKNGAIKDNERVRKEIQAVITDNNMNAKSAKIVISGTNIITRIIMVDKVADNEQNNKIWDEINACLPINLDEHKVDFKVLDTIKNGDKESVKVFVTAVAKKIINSYIDLLSKINMKPLSVDIPANSVAKFFKKNTINTNEANGTAKKKNYQQKSLSDTIAVIDLGSETTIVNVLKDKVPEFNRVTLLGSSNIDQSIFNALNLTKEFEDWPERYKKMYGLVSVNDLNNELEWQCSNAAKEVMNEILKNIRMCFDFYKSRCAGDEINKIFLIGGGAQMKGLKEYFEEKLEVPTYPINQLKVGGVEFAPTLDTGKLSYLINALGAAL